MADKGTAIDMPVTHTVDAEAAKNVSLDAHLINLMWAEPFFSAVLRNVTKIRSEDIPTAGVSASNGSVRLWWNPGFVASLTSDQVKGLLKHECYHLVFEHTTTRRHEPHLVWNYATDLAINSLIPELELPEGGLIPGNPFKELTEEHLANMSDEQVNRYNALSAKIASFPKEKSGEWYFSRLMDDPEARDAIENSAGGNGDGEGQPGMPGPMDDHDGWDELSEEERELVKGKVRKAVEGAAKECDRSGNWGSVSSEARSIIRELISREIPWQSVLKQFCGMTRRANRSSNVKRLNRKYPGIHPGFQKGYTSHIAVYIDQSGSVDTASLELLFGELRSLARQTEFTVFHFDTSVDEKSEASWRKGKTPSAHRTRCGGTCFRAPSEHANKNSSRFDGYIILTDGEASDPGPSRLKRGWVIIPDRELFFKPSNRDFVINMKQGASD